MALWADPITCWSPAKPCERHGRQSEVMASNPCKKLVGREALRQSRRPGSRRLTIESKEPLAGQGRERPVSRKRQSRPRGWRARVPPKVVKSSGVRSSGGGHHPPPPSSSGTGTGRGPGPEPRRVAADAPRVSPWLRGRDREDGRRHLPAPAPPRPWAPRTLACARVGRARTDE
jgi:hypothetical protein